MNTRAQINLIDETTRLLITAGAAMAANGDRLLEKTLQQLAETEFAPEMLQLPVFIGQQVKDRPASQMKEAADILVETNLSSNEEHVCPASKLDTSTHGYKITMLISAGAAMAANCEPCLNLVVPNLIEAGVLYEDIKLAVEIGQEVKDRVKTHTLTQAMEWIQKKAVA